MAAGLAALAACSDQSTPTAVTVPASAPASVPALAAGQIPTRQQERGGTFIERSDAELWGLIQQGEGRAVIGLKKPGSARGTWRGSVLMDRASWLQGRSALLARAGIEILKVDEVLPTVEVRIASQATLSVIRKLPMVDYVEPVMIPGDLHKFAGVGGCDWGTAWTGDRQLTSTRDIYSQKFTAMGIPAAWNYSTGAGVTIGLIDTGISSGQGQFTSTFASGSSTGRTMRFMKVASQASVYDECGHGTRMAGIIAAPWDGGSVGGIAYRANLISVRQASGVAAVSSSDAKESVRLAVSSGARVIVMAWESLNWWWQVSDEIEYWHYNTPTLFLGAAGTSGCGDGILDSNVVFPADMPEVMAVTGITYPGGGVPCGIHRGADVEVTAYLDVPSTGRYTADVVGMGGSSNATAVVGSVAALVWSRNPSLTRDQVRARLQQTAANYPNRHSEQGYGLINASRAVLGN